MKKTLLIILGSVSSLFLVCVLAFYILVVAGLSPKLQSIWVCSAMTTYSHKYLATAFMSDEKIEKIMEENKVDDSGHDSLMTGFVTEEETEPQIKDENDSENTEPIIVDKYLEEGYELLEEGVYLKEVKGDTWRGYVMLTVDPTRVKLVDTKKQYNCGQTTMQMVTGAGGVAAINGGGFNDGPNYDSNGGTPSGLIIEDGILVCPKKPNNTTTYNLIGFNSKGVLILRHATAQWALENDIVSAVSFNPFLVVNGEGMVKNGTGGWGIAPRTAIGQRATGEVLFLTIDGRQTGWSIGCDLDVLQKVLLEEKAVNGAMMDGGSSTVMIYQGEWVNKPSLGFERYINNCW
ncbi:MAG: hypothetical protein E7623_07140, partial [Ruminococcaceae bacterium]|nr:hypothetical protein [Oscillospiraceae bacterium]